MKYVNAHPDSLPAKLARAQFGQLVEPGPGALLAFPQLAQVTMPNLWHYWAFNTQACQIFGGEHCQWFKTPAVVADLDPLKVLELDNAVLEKFPGIFFARSLENPQGVILSWEPVMTRYIPVPHSPWWRGYYWENITDPGQSGTADYGLGREQYGF